STISAPLRAEDATTRQTTFDHRALAERALEQHIRPGFARLTRAFADLKSATAACAGNPAFDVAKLKPPFRDAAIAWGRVAHLTFGPLGAENRYDRIYFWIDRKGIGRRQIQRALRSKPDAYRDPAALAKRSIAVQGLPAFERLITTTAAASTNGTNTEFHCAFLQTIAANLVNIASRIEREWSADGVWGKAWLSPGADNPHFLDQRETTFMLLRAILVQIDRVRDVELSRPIGMTPLRRKRSGPFRLSGLTMPFLAARLAGLRDLLELGGLADGAEQAANAGGDRASRANARDAIAQARFELKFVAELAAKLAADPSFSLDDTPERAVGLGFPLKAARARIEDAFAAVTNLPVGFNASDGD
ncbi:MAG: imelysin family protein, partial [Pseudomonadota bacterium]